VLVCEDDDDVRRLVTEALTAQGHDTTAVDAVGPALVLLAAGGVEIVVTDRRLPDGDGLDVCRAGSHAGARAVVMTANVDDELELAVAGCHAVLLSKPFTLTSLLDAVARSAARPTILP